MSELVLNFKEITDLTEELLDIMVPPQITRSSRPAGNDDRRDREYDPNDLSDEDDLRQGAAPERPIKRVIILLDMDCYEAQVWIKEKHPELENQDVPVVVVNFDKIILAVNYTAKLLGVKRGNVRRHLEEMEQKYPQLVVIETGELFGKQDCFTPQKRSDDIFQVLLDYQKTLKDCNSITIERSSKDEVYIDVTKLVRFRSHPAGSSGVLRPPRRKKVDQLTSATKTHPNVEYKGKPVVVMEGRSEKIHGTTLNYRIMEVYSKGLAAYHADETCLAHGALIALQLIKLIKERTGFDASAGVAHNKLLAKLACDRNKPQGITIFTDISIPRVSKKLEHKDIPGFGGKRGQDLLKFFSDNGRVIESLHGIITLPLDDLIAAFEVQGSIDPESDAMALIDKCRGEDESMVTQRHFADTINASINFKGTHSVRTMDEFKYRVMSLSLDVSNRIKYSIERWNRSPHTLVAKVKTRWDFHPCGNTGNLKMDGFVDAPAIHGFIMEYVKPMSLEFGGIEGIKVTASDFKVSSVDEVANIKAAKDVATQSASAAKDARPESSKSEEGEVKTLRINFKGSKRLKTSSELWRNIERFSEKIAEQIDYYITTQRKCPSELVVNVTLFAGSNSKLTEEHSLETFMFDLPEDFTIYEFVMGYIEENELKAPQIETVTVTLKGIEKFGSESAPWGELLPTTKGHIPCPYVFSTSEEED